MSPKIAPSLIPAPVILKGVAMNYEWGGKRFIPDLVGLPNSERLPFAEYWMGAHPSGPAEILDLDLTLSDFIARDPRAILGEQTFREFGGLPYLFKVLDAEKMLSIQAHPSAEQAKLGFARENALGISLSARNRNYKDTFPKPEIHVALTDFWMLHGFKPFAEIQKLFLSHPLFKGLKGTQNFQSLPSSDEASRRKSLRGIFGFLMNLEKGEANRTIGAELKRLANSPGGFSKAQAEYWVAKAGENFVLPSGDQDRGIFLIYLLNLLALKPGQATFQDSGVLHAYLEGSTMELMANSDNVLRGGLTPKHVDVPELMATLTFASGAPSRIEGTAKSITESVYVTPAREFEISRIEIGAARKHRSEASSSAHTLIVLEGQVTLRSGETEKRLKRGEVAFVPAICAYTLESEAPAAVYKASVPKI